MNGPPRRPSPWPRQLISVLSALALLSGESMGLPLPQAAPPAAAQAPARLTPDQLDSLVAPIALYPDPLLAQTLAASTYPLEIIQLSQWMAKNPGLKEQSLADAVAKQPWDPAIQSMAAFPDVVKRLSSDIQWTTDLGNAFLSDQAAVMDAVQRMRKKAQDKGTLKSSEQVTVETKVIEKKEVIIVESAQPDVIYVPSYDPVVVYGAPIYPYPPIYYPPYYAGAAFVSFSFGVFMGAVWGGACCGCGWGHNDININRNNNFNRVSHYDRGSGNRGGGNWQHNAQHRGGTPYGDRATATKYGGAARGDSMASRRSGAQQQLFRTDAGGRINDRSAGTGSRGGASASDRAAGSGGRGAGAGDRSAGGGNNRVGSRDVPTSPGDRGTRGGGGFSGASDSFSGRSARSNSSRGSSSFGGSGGFSRGGGGGSRGGGGGRRR